MTLRRSSASAFVCRTCGHLSGKWAGRCDECGNWNTMAERPPARSAAKGGQAASISSLANRDAPPPRFLTNLAEFDRVLGGGFVPGSATLIAGDPGIGKSTLLLQIAAGVAAAGRRAVYVSGEESPEQIRMRASRLGLSDAPVDLIADVAVENVRETLLRAGDVGLLIVDSVQTMRSPDVDSAPGTVGQIRGSGQALIDCVKECGTALVLVGHVTKDGQIAGPRLLEHMVDTVVRFEGDRGDRHRILRTIKNRFGPTDETGVFEMRGDGLKEVSNPSLLFLNAYEEGVPGIVVFAGIEGTRPILVEIQVLTVPSPLANPRRAVVGWDANRLSMILAVLDARCGLSFAERDLFLNVAGGFRIREPGADLAVAAALISSLTGAALPPRCAAYGEVGLSGSVRNVARADARLAEASKCGFTTAFTPPGGRDVPCADMNVKTVENVLSLAAILGTPPHGGFGAR